MAELDDPKRLAVFSASILNLTTDAVLQDCVERAARFAEAPTALVSFVLQTVLLFRAAVGLPPEIEATRGTSRGHSLCQFVVKTEGPFTVEDARTDVRVSRLMVDTYGIVAYAGVPIHAGGQVLGSLCVADHAPRQWRPDLVSELQAIAKRVSRRLELLAASGTSADELTVVPLVSIAARASALAQVVQRSVAEVGPMVRFARSMMHGASPDGVMRAGSALMEASGFYDEMIHAIAELCVATKRMEQSIVVNKPANV